MPNHWGSKGERNQASSFVTIDDAIQLAWDLLAGLIKLGAYKHPLDVRRGVRKGVREVGGDEVKSSIIKAGSKTYYFDVLEAKNGNLYLKISESRSKGKKGAEERSSIIVFAEAAQDFADAVSDTVSMLADKK